jgi:hypothetical protein
MKTRQRNAEIQRKKQERMKAKDEETKRKIEQNLAVKEQIKSRIEISKLQKLSKNQSKANEARLEKTVLAYELFPLGCYGNDCSDQARN